MLGRCNIADFECTYHFDGEKLYLVPIDLECLGKLYRKIDNTEIKCVELLNGINSKSSNFAYFTKVMLLISGISCDIEYYFTFYSRENVSKMVLTSNELTSYVNPAERYYFLKKNDEEYKNVDFLYDTEGINEFKFIFESKSVEGRIVIGDMLKRGIASDLMLHAKLELSFIPVNNMTFFVDLCKVVKKSLQFAVYSKDINMDVVELFSETGRRRKLCGYLHFVNDKKSFKFEWIKRCSHYYFMHKYLGELFTEIARDKKLFIKHLPDESQQYLDRSVMRCVNVFSAFENEYNKLPNETRLCDTSNIEDLREKIVKMLENVEAVAEDEQYFLSELISKTSQLGKQYGMNKKIERAYKLNQESLEYTFKMYGIDEKKLKKIIRELTGMRNRIVHNNYDLEIENPLYIAIIEWITYAMFLKRIGMSATEIESSIGIVFQCNILGEKRMGEKNS